MCLRELQAALAFLSRTGCMGGLLWPEQVRGPGPGMASPLGAGQGRREPQRWAGHAETVPPWLARAPKGASRLDPGPRDTGSTWCGAEWEEEASAGSVLTGPPPAPFALLPPSLFPGAMGVWAAGAAGSPSSQAYSHVLQVTRAQPCLCASVSATKRASRALGH